MTNWSAFPSTGARATIWNYNQYRGWLDSKSYPDSTGPSYTYTSAGRPASRAWARGTNTSFTYNNTGENGGQSYNDGSTPNISNILDRRSRQATNIQGSVITSRTFDDNGNLLGETYSGGPLDRLSVTNGYDQFLRRTNLSLLNSSTPKLTNSTAYDSASRLQSVSDGQGNSATYAYLANSPLIDHIDYTSGGSLRMTRSNQFDNLNRLTNLVWRAGSTTIASFAYQYNDANQRTRSTLADGSYWLFGYDSLGQVTSGRKYWSDGTPVAGEQFEYGFDDIGNRTVTRTGGDRFGYNLRPATYGANLLNQYTNRTVPGYLNVLGAANPNATVSLWTSDSYGAQATRHLDFFRGELAVISSTGALWLTVTNLAVLPNGSSADIVTNTTGNSFVPQTPEQFGYDSDGNLTNDGRFSITWDAENRPTSFTSLSTTPAASRIKIDCTYDSQWRRTQKVASTWNGSNYIPQSTNDLVYDGWNLIATLDHTNGILYSFTWGLDLSGSQQGAGGIGGLISMRVHAGPLAGTYFYVFDGNGNVMALVNAADATVAAQYEYGPFGELLRTTGPLALVNAFRFSTKSEDDGTMLAYYGYRYYSPSAGRWISRDPSQESGGANLYSFCKAGPLNSVDSLGLTPQNDAAHWLGGLRRLMRTSGIGSWVGYENVVAKLRDALFQVGSMKYAATGDSYYDRPTRSITIGPQLGTRLSEYPDIQDAFNGSTFGHELTHAYDDMFLNISFKPLDDTEGHAFRFDDILRGLGYLIQLERLLKSKEHCDDRVAQQMGRLWANAWRQLNYEGRFKDVPGPNGEPATQKPVTASDHKTYVEQYGLNIHCKQIATYINLITVKGPCPCRFVCDKLPPELQ